jgi:signal transduction histidine kinase
VAHAFDTMADEVARAETVRRRLAADVPPELRIPLAALQAGLEELRDGLREPDTPRLAALHDQTLRLGRVVADLADLSAAESAALSLHPVDTDLAQVARAALAAQHPQLDSAGLRVDADLATPVPVRADPDRIHQAIANLLANAVRYCRPGDRVTVRARADDHPRCSRSPTPGQAFPPTNSARLRPPLARAARPLGRRVRHRPRRGPGTGHCPRRHGHRRIATRRRHHCHHPPAACRTRSSGAAAR